MHPRQQFVGIFAACASGSLAAWLVDVAESVESAVSRPAIGDDRRAWLDVVGDEGMKRASRGIRKDHHPASPIARGTLSSTATPTRDFFTLARPPDSPGSSPPMNVSSTSTTPVRRSRR